MSSSFPLPWERVRWRSRRLGVSDFRVVQLRRGTPVAEVALHDISSIHVVPSLIERITGVGTVVVTSTRAGDGGIRVRVAAARGTALRLNLLLTDLWGAPPDDGVMDQSAFALWRLPPTVRLQATCPEPRSQEARGARMENAESRVNMPMPQRLEGVPRLVETWAATQICGQIPALGDISCVSA